MNLPDSEACRAAVEVVRVLRGAGFEALLAGGCVRDMLLGREPHDFDVATSARPGEVRSLFPRTVAVGAQFGVVVVVSGGQETQVATFRHDGEYRDGRRPGQVTFTDAEGDAARRDFTINGLFYDPVGRRVLDFVGGQQDLRAGVVRAIGDPAKRFSEDRLRLLRAVRFAASLGFAIERRTWDALRSMPGDILSVSAERIRDEVTKIFVGPGRVEGFDLLDRSGLLAAILPEVAALKGCEQPPDFHPEGDVFVHTRLMLSLLPAEVSAPLVFSVLFHDIGKPATRAVDETGRPRFNGHERVGAEMAEGIMARLRFSNHEIERTVEAVRNHMAFKDVQNMREAKLKRFLARENFAEELELHRVDCLASHGMLDNHAFLLRKIEEFAKAPLIPPRLLTGRDLIAAGYRPGPAFKEILEAVQTLQLEGKLADSGQAMRWVAENYPLPG